MATAKVIDTAADLKKFTDCMYFINGHCKLSEQCRFRHCHEAAAQTNNCHKWPKSCRNLRCPYRHPGTPSKKPNSAATATSTAIAKPVPVVKTAQEGIISFFWDIENVPIPRGQKPFDIVQRIREKLVVGSGLREYSFSCYCNSTTIPQENQLSLHHANVRIIHVPDRKPGAVDRQIMLELDRFERAHRPPGTIVLISGDIDFVGKLSDLRHQAGFHVIIIHNKPAKTELKATVNAHYPWEHFTQTTDSVATPPPPPPPLIPSARHHRRADPSPTVTHRDTKTQLQSCPQCSNDFESIQALRQHQEAKSHFFSCPVCKENFFTSDGQQQHQKAKSHFEQQGFLCGQCNKRFPKLDSLNQHRQATGHLGQTVFASPTMATASAMPRMTSTSHDEFDVIQQGIAALVQHLPKIFKS